MCLQVNHSWVGLAVDPQGLLCVSIEHSTDVPTWDCLNCHVVYLYIPRLLSSSAGSLKCCTPSSSTGCSSLGFLMFYAPCAADISLCLCWCMVPTLLVLVQHSCPIACPGLDPILVCLFVQRVKKLPPNWKYESATASALVA